MPCDQLLYRRTGGVALDESSRVVEALERGQLFLTSELRALDRRLQHLNRLIVDPKRHRKRMPVLATVSKREARRVGEAVRLFIHDLGDHYERAHGPRSDAWNEEQFGKVGRAPIRRCSQVGVKARRRPTREVASTNQPEA
jgi:hypothetical protein